MGRDLDGADLGKGLDQIPSGLYRLRVQVGGLRLTETGDDPAYLMRVRDRMERLRIRIGEPRGMVRKFVDFLERETNSHTELVVMDRAEYREWEARRPSPPGAVGGNPRR